MNIGEYCIRRKTVTLVLCVVVIAVGLLSYFRLGRLEDPEFSVKTAVVITPYPGATAMEVAEEVSDEVETELQQLAQLDKVTSLSTPGLSVIMVDIQDKYGKNAMPQVFDEVRRRVHDVQDKLPPGAGPSTVNDNFGDVHGILFTVSGQGYTHEELREYAKFLRKELLRTSNVAKIELKGVQDEVIYIDFSHLRMAELGIGPDLLAQTLASQNLVQPSGSVVSGGQRLAIRPTGDFLDVDDIAELQIRDTSSDRVLRVKDVATVSRGYVDPPSSVVRYNGAPAISLGISVVPGGNVVTLGEAVRARLTELEPHRPVGVEFGVVNFQPRDVTEAVDGFILNFAQALVIVVVVLLVFMGLKSGLLIGAVLVLTVLGTMIVMDVFDITMQRVSLGALIIALGMLVDNAIVVTEGMLVRIRSGMDKLAAAHDVVGQNLMPLFGATVIAVLAFAAIGGAQNSAGEYCRSLFHVVMISLLLSWLLAVTVTPLFCHMLFRPVRAAKGGEPYQSRFYNLYRRVLALAIRFRWPVIGAMLVMLVAATQGFGMLKSSFFPASTRPQFQIHYWLPAGADISATTADIAAIEEHLLADERVASTVSVIGGPVTRFILTINVEMSQTKSYGLVLVNVHDHEDIDVLIPEIRAYLAEHFPHAEPKVKRFVLGPPNENDVEVRFSGPDPDVLRQLSARAKEIMYAAGGQGIRDDWRQKVKVMRPLFNETLARKAGVTRQEVHEALQLAYSGMPVGVLRERDELISIVARSQRDLRGDVGRVDELHVWSRANQAMVPLTQVVSGFDSTWEDQFVRHRDRKLTVTASCDAPDGLLADQMRERVAAAIEAMQLPLGYSMEWGGEYESSRDARAALGALIPMIFLGMVLIVVMLFNSVKQTLIVWLTVPLAIVGVTVGLLLFDLPFDFMATLGFLSLVGMLIKNAIVLIDQVNLDLEAGKSTWDAVLDAGVSRLRPVCMTAVTTILGMFPLLQDKFFVSMAVTIMFGLAFATVLTLVFVPVLFATFYRVREQG
jgi:multidrug efflux pump subunit AcrB